MTEGSWRGTSIISIEDFTSKDFETVIELTEKIRADAERGSGEYAKLLEGIRVASAFFENSSRTRLSHRIAANLLSVDDQDGFYGPEGTSIMKGESTHDTVRMLIGYDFDAMVMRHPQEGAARWAEEVARIAVNDDFAKTGNKRNKLVIFNGGDGSNQHPTQVLLDIYTIYRKQGRIHGLDIGLFGDIKHSRVAGSWFSAAPLLNANLSLGFPEGFGPDNYVLSRLTKKGVKYKTYNELAEALQNVDVAIILRPQLERMRDDEKAVFTNEWMLTAGFLEKLKLREGFMIMHPLPRNKFQLEIATDVDKLPCAWYFQQESFGPWVRAALFALTCSKLGDGYKRENKSDLYNSECWCEILNIDESRNEERYHKVGRIDGEGVVIDHLPSGTATPLIKLLGLKNIPKYIGMDLKSKKIGGGKDIVKYDGIKELDTDSLVRIKLFAPEASVNYISNGKVAKKFRVILPDRIGDVARCNNPRCITNQEHHEHVPSSFYVDDKNVPVLRCVYCEKITAPTKRNMIVVK